MNKTMSDAVFAATHFYLCHIVQTVSGAHPASHPSGTRGSSHGGKASKVWSW